MKNILKNKAWLLAGAVFLTAFCVWFFFSEENFRQKKEISLRREKLEDSALEKEVKESDYLPEKEGGSTAEAEAVEKTVSDPVDLEVEVEKKISPKNFSVNEIAKGEPEESRSEIKIEERLVSWGYEKKAPGRKIDTVVIHTSYNSLGGDLFSVSRIIEIYKSYGVTAHYLIDRKGIVYRLVQDKDVAYHAGESRMPDGRTGVNAFSIGIEIINSKTDRVESVQYQSLNKLLGTLKKNHPIKSVLGHSDIAPGRKDDPWNFDFGRLEK